MAVKICIVGAPSCRKTTVAEQLKIRLKTQGYNAEIAAEYARSYILRYGVPATPAEQVLITSGQIELEGLLMDKHDIVICDSASFLGYVYTTQFPQNEKNKAIKEMVHQIIMPHVDSYDYVFYAPKQERMVDDNVRYQSDQQTTELDLQIKGFLDLERIPYIVIKGSVDEKVAHILSILADDEIIGVSSKGA